MTDDFVDNSLGGAGISDFEALNAVVKTTASRLFTEIRHGDIDAVREIVEECSSETLKRLLHTTLRLTESFRIASLSESSDKEVHSLSEATTPVLVKNHRLYTPLSLAARLKKDDISALLVRWSPEVSSHDNMALRWAVKHGNVSLVASIITSDTFQAPQHPENLIYLAATNGNVELLKILYKTFTPSFTAEVLSASKKKALFWSRTAVINYLEQLQPSRSRRR